MNAARDLANKGEPGRWFAHPHGIDGPDHRVVSDDQMSAADAEKIVDAVNALPAWADYDDAVMAYLKHQTECTVGPLCVRLDGLFGELTRKRAAVEAVLRGES